MAKLELFFDYSCPFCLKGYNSLAELLPEYPDIEVVWRPCEAHPRPESGFGKHSDLCIQGLFFAAESGVDLPSYHERTFACYHNSSTNVEDIEAFALSLEGLLDVESLRQALTSGKYNQALRDANAYAFEESGVWVIPSFRMNGYKLDAAAGIGVTKAQIKSFLDRYK